jgi:next-to-BRCA1 protein 1
MTSTDFDYCSTCLNKADVRSKHATNHKFICIAKPSDPIHRGILCDSCNVTIAGVRHKCLDCRDFDLCTTCISGGAIERMDHNPFHQFYEINTPGRVVVHNVYSGVGENTASAPRAAHHAAPVPPPAPVAPAPPPPATHAALCDLCDSNIVGDRYVSAANRSI